MIIRKRRIRTLKPYRGLLTGKKGLVIGVTSLDRFSNILGRIGFTRALENGESVLPTCAFGPVSQFNAEGKYIKHKNQPMETAYRTVEWHWEEWSGPYDRIPQSKFVDVPYQRYPRTFINPPSLELKIVTNSDGQTIIASPQFGNIEENEDKIIHAINLFLEIFGECQFFTENLDAIIKVPLKRLNWRILPPGRRLWQVLQKEVDPLIKQARKGNQSVIRHRLQVINKRGPDFTAVGESGFYGYIIFGFSKKNIYALESLYYGNATYIFGERWEELSKMTKSEILNEKLQKDRIIHREGWEGRLGQVFKQ